MKPIIVLIAMFFIACGVSPRHTVDTDKTVDSDSTAVEDIDVTDDPSDEDTAVTDDITDESSDQEEDDAVEDTDVTDDPSEEDIPDTAEEDLTDDTDEDITDDTADDLIDEAADEDTIDEDVIDEDTVPQDPPVKNLYGNQALYCVAYEGSISLECGGVSADQLYAAHSIPYGETITVEIDPESIVKAAATTYSISFLLTDGTLKVWGVPDEKWPNGATEMPLREASMKLKNIWQVSPNMLFGVRVDDDELVQWGTGYAFYNNTVGIAAALPLYARNPSAGQDWDSIKEVTEAGSDCIIITGKTYCNRPNGKGNGGRGFTTFYKYIGEDSQMWYRNRSAIEPKWMFVGNSPVVTVNSQCTIDSLGTIWCWGLAPVTEIYAKDPNAAAWEQMMTAGKLIFVAPTGLKLPSPIPLINGTHLQLMYTATEMWTFVRGSFDYATGMGPVEPLAFPFGNIKEIFDGIGESWMILTTDGEVWSLKAETKAFKKMQLPYSAKTW